MKLSSLVKDRIILECITNKSNDVATPDGSRLLSFDDLFGLNAIPDTRYQIPDTRYQIQFVMKILILIAQRNILIKLDRMQHWKC